MPIANNAILTASVSLTRSPAGFVAHEPIESDPPRDPLSFSTHPAACVVFHRAAFLGQFALLPAALSTPEEECRKAACRRAWCHRYVRASTAHSIRPPTLLSRNNDRSPVATHSDGRWSDGNGRNRPDEASRRSLLLLGDTGIASTHNLSTPWLACLWLWLWRNMHRSFQHLGSHASTDTQVSMAEAIMLREYPQTNLL